MNRQHLTDIFNAALEAVDARQAVLRAIVRAGTTLSLGTRRYDLAAYDRILVVGAGKATARMAQAAEEVLGDALAGGIIIVKQGHTGPLTRVRQVEASHPIPDDAGEGGTKAIMELLQDADDRTLVLCLLSGGGSALLVAPAQGVTLADKQTVTDLLLRAGADIGELNAVRKHLSAVKGGRLARIAHPATVITLMLSDVIGDRLDVIASGPTVPDPTTFGDALSVLEKYGLRDKVPRGVVGLFDEGLAGRLPETPKEGDPCFQSGHTVIVGSLLRALVAGRERAERLGYGTEIITAELRGEARDAARFLAEKAMRVRDGLKPSERRCLLSGGETTVRVIGGGRGGRNQELSLAFALAIEGTPDILLLSAGTDGTDGPTDAAGAVVDGGTARAARKAGIDPVRHLAYNDSYTLFARLDAATGEHSQVTTGPTGTNVMDMQIMLIGQGSAGG